MIDHDRLPPAESDAINDALVKMAMEDPANWRQDQWGSAYYVGPTIAGDGTINWPTTPATGCES